MNLSDNKTPSKKTIMKAFFEKVAGKNLVDIGSKTYHMPINYKTDEKEVIINQEVPVIDLRNNNLQAFEEAMEGYVKEYFSSEKYWANPITNCQNNDDKLAHAIAIIWLNATKEDYEKPMNLVRRYADFIRDNTFEEFIDGKTIKKLQTLRNCSIEIRKEEQEEFQETPDAILFTVEVSDSSGKVQQKKLPRVAYGISDKVAYIYGIQGYKEDEKPSPEMKKVNRSRYQVNNMENIPEGYKNVYAKQEPYAYISLFTFLCMLKQKGITRVIMPDFLPLRYEGKELGMLAKAREIAGQLETETTSKKEKREFLKKIDSEMNNHQRIQYTITNKFLAYMSRLESDVPGVEIKQTPDENQLGIAVDISNMQPQKETNLIFYELSKKIEELMKQKSQEEER